MTQGWGGAQAKAARRLIRNQGQHQPCWRCRKAMDLDVDRWEVGHIRDRALGGSNRRENLAPECFRCNRSSGGKLGRMRQLAAKEQGRRRAAKTRRW